MDEEKKWMLMTYYCPTNGDSGFVKPIQLTKKEISKTFLKKTRSSKINFLKLKRRYCENVKYLHVIWLNQKLIS